MGNNEQDVDISPVISLNVNELNITIKRQRWSEWREKQDATTNYLQ